MIQPRKYAPFIILFFFLATITAPARAVLMLVPVAEAIMATGEGVAVVDGITSGAIAIGTVVSAILLNNDGKNTVSQMQKILTGSKVPTPTPPGYTPPSGSSLEPVPPGTYGAISKYSTQNGTYAASVADTALASCQGYVGELPGHTPSQGVAQGTGCFLASNLSEQIAPIQQILVCETGYTLTNGVCTLADPSLVPLPASEPPTSRPTPGASPTLAPVPGSAPSTVPTGQQSGVNPDNLPMNISVQPVPLPDGQTGTQTTVKTQLTDANGVTMTKTQTFTTDENGVVTSVVTSLAPTDLSGTVQTGANTAGPGAPIQFPTDYNREPTQQAIKANTDALKVDSDAMKKNSDDLNQKILDFSGSHDITKDDLNTAMDSVKQSVDDVGASGSPLSTFGFGFAPVLPGMAQCTPLQMTPYKGYTASYDWCPIIDAIRDILGMVLYMSTGFYLLQLLTRKGSD